MGIEMHKVDSYKAVGLLGRVAGESPVLSLISRCVLRLIVRHCLILHS